MNEDFLFKPVPLASAPARDSITKAQVFLKNLVTELRATVLAVAENAPAVAETTIEQSESLQNIEQNRVLDEEMGARSMFMATYINALHDNIPELPDSSKTEDDYNNEIAELEKKNLLAAERLRGLICDAEALDDALNEAIECFIDSED